MKDRIVQYPNRYTDQNGNTLTLTPAPGTVTEEGTPLNKANLLTDATATLVGLSENNATPDKAFERIKTDFEAGDASLSGRINVNAQNIEALTRDNWKLLTIIPAGEVSQVNIDLPDGVKEIKISWANTSSVKSISLDFNTKSNPSKSGRNSYIYVDGSVVKASQSTSTSPYIVYIPSGNYIAILESIIHLEQRPGGGSNIHKYADAISIFSSGYYPEILSTEWSSSSDTTPFSTMTLRFSSGYSSTTISADMPIYWR